MVLHTEKPPFIGGDLFEISLVVYIIEVWDVWEFFGPIVFFWGHMSYVFI